MGYKYFAMSFRREDQQRGHQRAAAHRPHEHRLPPKPIGQRPQIGEAMARVIEPVKVITPDQRTTAGPLIPKVWI
jgi:hypothetical protein